MTASQRALALFSASFQRARLRRCCQGRVRDLSICLTEVVFLRPKLTQIDRSTCKVRLFALGRGPFPKAWRELFCRW